SPGVHIGARVVEARGRNGGVWEVERYALGFEIGIDGARGEGPQIDASTNLSGGDEEDRIFGIEEPEEGAFAFAKIDHALGVKSHPLEECELAERDHDVGCSLDDGDRGRPIGPSATSNTRGEVREERERRKDQRDKEKRANEPRPFAATAPLRAHRFVRSASSFVTISHSLFSVKRRGLT